MEKKRFILFGFDYYYPSGGLEDVIATFNEEEYIDMKKHEENWDELQILDTETNTFYCTSEKNTLPQIHDDKAEYLDEDSEDEEEIDDAINDHLVFTQYLLSLYNGRLHKELQEIPETDKSKPILFLTPEEESDSK